MTADRENKLIAQLQPLMSWCVCTASSTLAGKIWNNYCIYRCCYLNPIFGLCIDFGDVHLNLIWARLMARTCSGLVAALVLFLWPARSRVFVDRICIHQEQQELKRTLDLWIFGWAPSTFLPQVCSCVKWVECWISILSCHDMGFSSSSWCSTVAKSGRFQACQGGLLLSLQLQ